MKYRSSFFFLKILNKFAPANVAYCSHAVCKDHDEEEEEEKKHSFI